MFSTKQQVGRFTVSHFPVGAGLREVALFDADGWVHEPAALEALLGPDLAGCFSDTGSTAVAVLDPDEWHAMLAALRAA